MKRMTLDSIILTLVVGSVVLFLLISYFKWLAMAAIAGIVVMFFSYIGAETGPEGESLPYDVESYTIDGIDHADAPDYVDAYISEATFKSGRELTSDELEELNTKHNDWVYEKVLDYIY